MQNVYLLWPDINGFGKIHEISNIQKIRGKYKNPSNKLEISLLCVKVKMNGYQLNVDRVNFHFIIRR